MSVPVFPQRASGTFSALRGNNAQINETAARLANDILSNPTTATINRSAGVIEAYGGAVVTVRKEAGQGVRYLEETKEFIGFVD